MADPKDRLNRWIVRTGTNQSALAREIGCSPALVSAIILGKRVPNLHVAHAIERLTANSPEGKILTEEWDVAEVAREGAAPPKKGRAA